MDREEQLLTVINAEKDKLNRIVSCRQDLRKRETIEQSWKLDGLVVRAMREQLRQRKSSAK